MTTSVLRRLPVLAAAALILSACDDPTAPAGTPGEVEVLAYVDADGSGEMSEGDPRLTGATVHLERTDGTESFTAEVDAAGRAHFQNVPPGAYIARLDGEAPDGAVLATPSRPAVSVPFQGGTVTTEFRFVYNPGTISGVVFRDDDGSGEFNPEEDTPAEGVQVRLHRGTEVGAEPIATTSSDAQGRFRFDTLRPGTYTIEIVPLETIEIVGETVRQVTVAADAETEVLVEFVGELLITIEEARDRDDGTAVEVEGVVLADQGTYDFNDRDTYIQDPTGGVRLWQLDGDLGLEVGDSVRVSGTMSTFRDERQLDVATITVLGAASVPAPRQLTGSEIVGFEYDGQLAVSTPLTVLEVDVHSFDAHNVVVEHEDGTEFEIRVESPNEIPSDYWEVGATYQVTGVLGRFFGTPQIKPRGFADVVALDDIPAGSIAAARMADDGATVEVEGVVVADQGTYDFQDRDTYIQDSTAGVRLWQLDGDLDLQVGDSVRVTGEMSTFRDERQLEVSAVTVLGTGTVPEAAELSVPEINAFQRQGELAVATDLTVTEVATFSFDAHSVTAVDPDGNEVEIRVESPNEISSGDWEVGETYRVTGVLGRFFETAQIKPRGSDDVEAL